jgi:hypothetical protein
MPAIDLSILNQRQTPAFYADTLANRPAAGFVGRIFVSTNTFAFFRDNGTGWDLIGGPGTGTVTGSGAAGQVSFWNGANTITGNNDLFWDNVNGHLGIGTNVPGTALQIDHDQSQLIRLNQTTATNDTKIAFQNSGTALWRIGNSYNAGANDFGIFDVIGAFQPVTVKKTTGQVLIGTSTVGSGKLVVASATGDNGVQIVGAAAPSLRIDNAESGPTKRAGLGISTATNNFIQGSADRDFCMFNGSTTASPILFGIYDTTNVQEAARISAARNFLIGTTTDGGQKLQVNGKVNSTGYFLVGSTAGSGALYYDSVANRVTLANYNASGILTFEVNGGTTALTINSNLSATFGSSITANSTTGISGSFISSNFFGSIDLQNTGGAAPARWNIQSVSGAEVGATSGSSFGIYSYNASAYRLFITGTGNVGINTLTPAYKLEVDASNPTNGIIGQFYNTATSSQNGSFVLYTQFGIADWYIGQPAATNALAFGNGKNLSSVGSEYMRISSNGSVLINRTIDINALFKLQVEGRALINSNQYGLLLTQNAGSSGMYLGADTQATNTDLLFTSGTTGGTIANINGTTGVYTAVSDKNLKKNFEQSNLGLEAILKLKPTLYNMISQSDHEAKELGFIAQEVKEVIEQAYIENGNFIGLNYQAIVATLVKAIQDLNNKIENLKN